MKEAKELTYHCDRCGKNKKCTWTCRPKPEWKMREWISRKCLIKESPYYAARWHLSIVKNVKEVEKNESQISL